MIVNLNTTLLNLLIEVFLQTSIVSLKCLRNAISSLRVSRIRKASNLRSVPTSNVKPLNYALRWRGWQTRKILTLPWNLRDIVTTRRRLNQSMDNFSEVEWTETVEKFSGQSRINIFSQNCATLLSHMSELQGTTLLQSKNWNISRRKTSRMETFDRLTLTPYLVGKWE